MDVLRHGSRVSQTRIARWRHEKVARQTEQNCEHLCHWDPAI